MSLRTGRAVPTVAATGESPTIRIPPTSGLVGRKPRFARVRVPALVRSATGGTPRDTVAVTGRAYCLPDCRTGDGMGQRTSLIAMALAGAVAWTCATALAEERAAPASLPVAI